ncbi:tyrosine-type recombinase/integrase [Maridesulfovibrio frigidus]|uniref:tyrosine-type recombinase/integrase n=1 Tax=Maridesulfovibrio frigidus TaxID=340956 RepID=UPI0004E27FE5|nr:site-specific integrase [Maridesulfovibrio frigidus]
MKTTKAKWTKVKGAIGLRYYEFPDRKYKGKLDRYYSCRWSRGGQKTEEGIGWSSEGWKVSELVSIRHTLQQNYKKGSGPTTFTGLKAEHERKQAESKLHEEQEQVKEITFREFFEQFYIPWKRDRKKRTTWADDVKRANNRIHPFLGELPLPAITPELLQEFMDELYDDGLADATVLHHMAIIRSVFNRAAATVVGDVVIFPGQTPLEHVDLPHIGNNNQRQRFLTKEEAKLIISSTIEKKEKATIEIRRKSWQDLHDAVVLSLNTGMRMGEIQRVEWHDVNFYGKSLTVRLISSGQKPGGNIPINSAALEMLMRRKKESSDALIFPPAAGGKKRENLSHKFKDVVDELELNKLATAKSQRIVFHSLRHTFASWLAIAGVDIYRIKTLMRHKTINMTMRYAHLSPDMSQGAVELLTIK